MRKINLASSCVLLLAVPFYLSTVVYAEVGQGFSTVSPENSKLHGALQQLIVNEISDLGDGSVEGAIALRRSEPVLEALPPIVEDGYVVIDAVAKNNSEGLERELKALGMKNASRFGHMVSGSFPVNKLSELSQLNTLQFVTDTLAMKNKGVITSQGDVAMNADIAREQYDVKGAGVKIGVLSDSYDCFGGAASGIATGDLPADLNVLQEANCNSGNNTDEGRAMVEIIHDVAPESSLLFHTAYGGQAAFANGIIALANAGAKVIVDDIKYYAEPFFQDGIIAQAVDQVNQLQDVNYFSSAGNSGRDAYASEYRNMGNFMNFSTWDKQVDICLEIEVKAGSVVVPVLQWDQPFFSVTGDKGATTDLSMIMIQDCNPSRRVLTTTANNIGADPLEMAFIRNRSDQDLTLGIMVKRLSGPIPGKIKLVATGGTITDINKTQTGSSYGHAVARGAMGVGASVYRNAHPFVSPAIINYYSSAGGAEILFDKAGQRLAQPDVRLQPALVGPDGVDTTFFGSPYDDNNFPNFFGTSASAPHVAAVAALMRSHNPDASAEEVYSVLMQTANDMDDPLTEGVFDVGYDTATGYGFINALDALIEITPQATDVFCDGKLATIIGTADSDRLTGTAGDDVIVALGGDDHVFGKGGNDTICAGDGNDYVYTDAGNDKVFGEEGADYLVDSGGENELYGGLGLDRLIGGNGNDKLFGGADRDLMIGKQGDDVLIGGAGNDVAFGGEGQDTCEAEFLIQCE